MVGGSKKNSWPASIRNSWKSSTVCNERNGIMTSKNTPKNLKKSFEFHWRGTSKGGDPNST